eukprot:633291-Rhodomonas_salina.2
MPAIVLKTAVHLHSPLPLTQCQHPSAPEPATHLLSLGVQVGRRGGGEPVGKAGGEGGKGKGTINYVEAAVLVGEDSAANAEHTCPVLKSDLLSLIQVTSAVHSSASTSTLCTALTQCTPHVSTCPATLLRQQILSVLPVDEEKHQTQRQCRGTWKLALGEGPPPLPIPLHPLPCSWLKLTM